MADAVEVKQVPRHIVQAFIAKHGRINEKLEEWEWLDLFGAWYAGWVAGENHEREACAMILDKAIEWYSEVNDGSARYSLLLLALTQEASNIRMHKCPSTDTTP